MLSKNEEAPTSMKELTFKEEEFKKECNFTYGELRKKFKEKKATVRVMSTNGNRDECLAEKNIELSKYIGKGIVQERLVLTGKVYYVDMELTVES